MDIKERELRREKAAEPSGWRNWGVENASALGLTSAETGALGLTGCEASL